MATIDQIKDFELIGYTSDEEIGCYARSERIELINKLQINSNKI